MKYLPRRLSVSTHEGTKEISQEDFLMLDGPLVVLGEPGAGKSEFVKQVKELAGSQFYTASALAAVPTGIPISTGERVIIDALDEVTAYSAGAPIGAILSKILDEDTSKFIFTCRAVDWNHEVNTSIFLSRWKKAPLVGKLLPLNNNEIITFVEYNGSGLKGQEFFQSAVDHDSVELLRNPQMLLMLMKTVTRSGWPVTRTGLYEETCKALVEEENPFHRSSDHRYNRDELLDAAGAVSAQMILANKAFISLDGSSIGGTVNIKDLASDKHSTTLIRAVVSTKIFRSVIQTSVECSHRTILEYLGARFITAELHNTLSRRRLDTVLYAAGHIVPSALRGLHAWIATIYNGEMSRTLIDRDPYGVFRYGDCAVLSTELSRHLLKSLRKLSIDDPYFRNEDWHLRIGKGFAKPALKDDIIAFLKEPGIPFELTHLVLDSIKGQSFVNSLKQELMEVLLNASEIFVVRKAALHALQDEQVHANWKHLAKGLQAINNMDSLRLALDIIEFSASQFSGKEIASVLIAVSNASRRGTLYGGIGYGLQHKMSSQQLLDSLDALLRHRFDVNFLEPMYDDPKDWILQILLECFERNTLPGAETIWLALNRLKRHSHNSLEILGKLVTTYFESNPGMRIKVQWEGLFGPGKEIGRSSFFRLEEACRALHVEERDVLVHLVRVMKERGESWINRWNILAWYTNREPSFTRANKEIRTHASGSPDLELILAEFDKPLDRSWEIQERTEIRRWEKKEKGAIAKRHAQYSGVIESVKMGTHLQAISTIAHAYLGWYSDVKNKSPELRVADLVGEKNRKIALKSFAKAVSSAWIPTAREIIEFHIVGKSYYVEPILIAYCSQLHDKANASMDVLLSALAACRWGAHFINEEIAPKVQADLEQIIFSNVDRKEKFLRDTLELQLQSSAEHISGLDRLSKDDYFSDISGRLSVEWLGKYDNASNWSFESLLKSTFRYVANTEIISLAIRKIDHAGDLSKEQNDVWISVLFLLNFDSQQELVFNTFAGNCDKFWAVKESYSKYYSPEKLSPDQNYFILKVFSSCFSDDETLPAGFMGNRHPWEAIEFLQARANELAADLSQRATELLENLVSELSPSSRFYKHLKHVFSQHVRRKAEKEMRQVSLKILRPILFGGSPNTLRDLQSVVLDQLADFQLRLKGSPTDDYKVFWKETIPQTENYSRDRIVQYLEPLMNKLAIRAHVESQMPNVKRCDFLNTFNNMDVPVEVKGQWHKELWTAAISQLEDYTREYRAEGYGIYLVLWFGSIQGSNGKNPRKDRMKRVPSTAEEMNRFLMENYKEGISEKTKIFVLDVSRPPSKTSKKTKKEKFSVKKTSRKTFKPKKVASAGSSPKNSPAKKRVLAKSAVKKSKNKRKSTRSAQKVKSSLKRSRY